MSFADFTIPNDPIALQADWQTSRIESIGTQNLNTITSSVVAFNPGAHTHHIQIANNAALASFPVDTAIVRLSQAATTPVTIEFEYIKRVNASEVQDEAGEFLEVDPDDVFRFNEFDPNLGIYPITVMLINRALQPIFPGMWIVKTASLDPAETLQDFELRYSFWHTMDTANTPNLQGTGFIGCAARVNPSPGIGVDPLKHLLLAFKLYFKGGILRLACGTFLSDPLALPPDQFEILDVLGYQTVDSPLDPIMALFTANVKHEAKFRIVGSQFSISVDDQIVYAFTDIANSHLVAGDVAIERKNIEDQPEATQDRSFRFFIDNIKAFSAVI